MEIYDFECCLELNNSIVEFVKRSNPANATKHFLLVDFRLVLTARCINLKLENHTTLLRAVRKYRTG